MDFSFSSDQMEVRRTAEAFAREVLAPGYQDRERKGKLDAAMVRRMGELGLIGLELPEGFGGLGLDYVTAGLVMEAIAGGDFNMAYVQLLGSLNGHIIAAHARDDLARQWLPRICRGEISVALALTEPDHGSDAASLAVRAKRDGDAYVLDGEKTSISMADQAAVATVFARTGREEERAHGISAFLVPLDLPGIRRTRFEDVGEKAVGRGSIFFDGVRVPADHLLGGEGKGFTQVMQGFDFSRALIGLQCLAVADASLKETWRFLEERKAFGKTLSQFQGVTFPLAEYQTQIEAARLLCYKALWLKCEGRPHTAEAAMCKWWAPKLAFDTVHQCLLSHGHAGYSTELPFEQRLRDVLGLEIGDGMAQIMKLIIVRNNLGGRAAP